MFDVSLERLRRRTSEKWAAYPPDVLPVWVAEMDCSVPPAVREALERAIDLGDTGYAYFGELPAAFCDFARAEFGWAVPENRVFQVPDVMAGVAQALLALTQRGDRVVINPPVYAPFFEVLNTIERHAVHVPLVRDEQRRWHLDFDGLEAAFAAGAKAYLLCSPHNPVARVWSDEDVQRICELAEQYGVVIVADEIHAQLTLPGSTFVPLLSKASERMRCVSVMSASKAWNLAGLKCALTIAGSDEVCERLTAHFDALPTEILSRVGHFGVHASIAAFRDGRDWLHEIVAELGRNRTLLVELLREHFPQVYCDPPEATYLAWLDCSGLGLPDEPARYFLERGRVALEPGAKFGTGGEGYVRFNFGTSSDILREAVQRMRTAVCE
jgi:cystathionine beta-lyase